MAAGLAFVLGAGAVVWWCGSGAVAPFALAAQREDAASTVAAIEPERVDVAVAAVVAADGVPDRREPPLLPTAGPVDEPQIAAWVRALRDDGVAWNAHAAQVRLLDLPPGPVPALDRALTSTDVQQRHLAAWVLRRRSETRAGAPSARLLEVTVEALAAWLVEQLVQRRLGGDWNPGAECTRFLVPHAVAAREALRRGLGSGDEQQRFLCAWLLAQGDDREQVVPICRELLPHLADNDIAGDGVMAANGLYRLGAAALPTLQWWRQTVDAQARALLDLVIADLQQPPRSRGELVQRGRGQAATRIYHDPAIEFDVQRSPVPSWRPR